MFTIGTLMAAIFGRVRYQDGRKLRSLIYDAGAPALEPLLKCLFEHARPIFVAGREKLASDFTVP